MMSGGVTIQSRLGQQQRNHPLRQQSLQGVADRLLRLQPQLILQLFFHLLRVQGGKKVNGQLYGIGS
ncbi:hypothetical protein D3C75_805940 [compost metagenome]